MRSILLLAPFTLATACTATPLSADNPLTLLVGPNGASTHSDGIKIDVPAGAVDSEITLTAYPKDRVIDGVTTASKTWTFGPEGQTFNTAISVSLAYEGQHDAATVWWTKQGDLTTFTNLKTSKANGWATANVLHFSEGTVGDDTCSTGDEAESGDETESGDEADSGADCVDGIDASTGEECDGGPAANQDDGEEADDEQPAGCERDEDQANEDGGDDTDNVEE